MCLWLSKCKLINNIFILPEKGKCLHILSYWVYYSSIMFFFSFSFFCFCFSIFIHLLWFRYYYAFFSFCLFVYAMQKRKVLVYYDLCFFFVASLIQCFFFICNLLIGFIQNIFISYLTIWKRNLLHIFVF